MNEKLNFLVLDDDAIFNYLIKGVIDRSGLAGDVKIFTSSTEALEFLKDNVQKGIALPEIIILDIRMPILDGFAFMKHLEKLPQENMKDTRICLLTSSLNTNDQVRAKDFPMVIEYFIKPFNGQKLQLLLKKYRELMGKCS